MDVWPLGVFASIDAGLGVKLEIARELGVPTIQLHAPHAATRTPRHADEFLQRLGEYGMRITVVFAGFAGESYADIPTCKRTVGLVPRETRAARVQELKEIANFARVLEVDSVGLHVGFIPHDPQDPLRREMIAVIRDVCGHLHDNRQRLHLETGQETAGTLLAFLHDAHCDNLFVNFDPANMILYGSGDPIEAVRKVGHYVRSVHCKDARWSAQPGETWGQETPLGEGDVDFEQFLAALKEIGYTGPLTIEREIPEDAVRQKEEIGAGIAVLDELKWRLLPHGGHAAPREPSA
ncbi:MAG: sugar phosphate isomerase/epimerase family protein [Planctomycetota bacterium]